MEQVIEALEIADRAQMIEIAQSELDHVVGKTTKKDETLRKELIELAKSKMEKGDNNQAAQQDVSDLLPPEASTNQEAPKVRTLKNKTTGRIVTWTKTLAKLSHMIEVEG